MRGRDDVARGCLLPSYSLLVQRAFHYQHVCEIEVNTLFNIAIGYRRGHVTLTAVAVPYKAYNNCVLQVRMWVAIVILTLSKSVCMFWLIRDSFEMRPLSGFCVISLCKQ